VSWKQFLNGYFLDVFPHLLNYTTTLKLTMCNVHDHIISQTE